VKKASIEVVHSALGMVPQNYIKLEGAAANSMIRLLETLEDTDDVQNVYSNFDVDQKQLEEVAG
jgi:transcriptional/translational regulatory protein YebC/TACO1